MENRESFSNRIRPFFAPSVLLDIELAYMLAKYGHRAQRRKEQDSEGRAIRYFEHVRRVSLVLIDEVGILDRDLIVSALLHDALEDTRELTPEMLERVFGSDVVGIVKVLSKVPKRGYLDRFALSVDWRPYVVKACDRLDNLRSLVQTGDLAFQVRQVRETRDHYYGLFDRMVHLSPIAYRAGVLGLRDRVVDLNEKLSASLRSV